MQYVRPIINRGQIISARRDQLLGDPGCWCILDSAQFNCMETSDQSMFHLIRTELLIAGKRVHMLVDAVLLGKAPMQLLAPHRPPSHYTQPHTSPNPAQANVCSSRINVQDSAILPKQRSGNC